MSFNNHDADDPNGKLYGQKRELTKNNNPAVDEISNLMKDKSFGLPMQELFLKENYEQKKERFSKTEDFLAKLISETNDEKLMHTFLRWQELRNQLNQMYLQEVESIISNSEPKINTDFTEKPC
jgi:hypothetical protein